MERDLIKYYGEKIYNITENIILHFEESNIYLLNTCAYLLKNKNQSSKVKEWDVVLISGGAGVKEANSIASVNMFISLLVRTHMREVINYGRTTMERWE